MWSALLEAWPVCLVFWFEPWWCHYTSFPLVPYLCFCLAKTWSWSCCSQIVWNNSHFVLFFLVGYSPASEFYVLTFRNTVCSIYIVRVNETQPMKMEQTECSAMSAHKNQTPGNHPKERVQHSQHSESLKSRTVILFLARHLDVTDSMLIS